MKMPTVVAATVAAAFACACAAPPSAPAPQRMTEAPTTAAHDAFLLAAWRANAAEVAAARLALQRSHDVRVREFAQGVLRDHLATRDRLLAVAQQRGESLPPEAAAAADFGLQPLRGAAFDRAYVERAGLAALHDGIALLRQRAQRGHDAAGKFAAEELPVWERHLAGAQALQAQFELRRRNFSDSEG